MGLLIHLSRRWEVLEPLESSDFVRLWLATGIWWQAMWMEMLVMGWLALSLTDSAWWVALVGFFRAIPLPIIGLFGASITDRFRRRSLIAVLQLLNAAGNGLLALLLWTGNLEYWHIAAVATANGAWWALDWPTRRALLPDLVGRGKVVDAMVLENSIQSLTRISGPLGAGSLLAGVGILGSLFVLCGMGLIALLILLGMETDSRAPAAPGGITAGVRRVREGLGYVRRQPRILGVVFITVIMNVWAFPFINLLPVFARDVLHQGPLGLGLLGAAHGAGSFLGLLMVNWGRKIWSNEWLFTAGSSLFCIGLVGFSGSTSFCLSLALLMVGGIGQAGFSIMQSAITLVEASDEMRGRAMGSVVLGIGCSPLGRLQSGAMAEAWGAPLAVGTMAGFAGLATLAVGLLLAGFIGQRRREKEEDRGQRGKG